MSISKNKKLRKIKIFCNKTDSNECKVYDRLVHLLELNDFYICKTQDKAFDLGIAIGNSNSFIDMIKKTHFNQHTPFVDINTSKHTFSHNIPGDFNTLRKLVESLIMNSYNIDTHNYLTCSIVANSEKKCVPIKAISEIIFRRSGGKSAMFKVTINDKVCQTYYGDGLMLCSSTGSAIPSTGFDRCLVCGVEAIQLSPINPSRYKSLDNINQKNSILIPSNSTIKIEPLYDDRQITIDHDGETSKFENVVFEISAKKGIKKLNFA